MQNGLSMWHCTVLSESNQNENVCLGIIVLNIVPH